MSGMAYVIVEKETYKRVFWTLRYAEAQAEFERLGSENYIMGHKFFKV